MNCFVIVNLPVRKFVLIINTVAFVVALEKPKIRFKYVYFNIFSISPLPGSMEAANDFSHSPDGETNTL